MSTNFKYMPTFRSRQQENIVLQEFDFEDKMLPLIEVIKEKDRVNNPKSFGEIYHGLFEKVRAEQILVDLPTYIKDWSSMNDEVVTFNRTVLGNLEERLKLFTIFSDMKTKVIPVISTLLQKTGEANTIATQYENLQKAFPTIAVRTFTTTFELDIEDIRSILGKNDILVYDMDTLSVTNPLVKKHSNLIKDLECQLKIVLRSAINTDIYNVHLEHGEIVAEADNSLIELYKTIHFNCFGDYVGIKKDDFSAGGTISPGFIFYDPIDNLYYGFKGDRKQLSEFKDTIVPAVLESEIVDRMKNEEPLYLNENNLGYLDLVKIKEDPEDSGKSQARFKKITMEHYLHSMMVKIKKGEIS